MLARPDRRVRVLAHAKGVNVARRAIKAIVRSHTPMRCRIVEEALPVASTTARRRRGMCGLLAWMRLIPRTSCADPRIGRVALPSRRSGLRFWTRQRGRARVRPRAR
jgi:hypothetical protein